MPDPISTGLILKVGATILPLAIDPVCKLLNVTIEEAIGPGFASGMGMAVVRQKLTEAVEAVVKRGRKAHTGRGQDLLLKIAGKAGMKDAFMSECFQRLLVNAMDPNCNLDIRNEDVDFMDSLNPADAVVIDILLNHESHIKEYNNDPNGEVQKVFQKIHHMFNQDGDAMRYFKDNCISAECIVGLFRDKHRLNSHLGLKVEHVQATFTERIQKKGSSSAVRPIIHAEGWHEYGLFEFPVNLGQNASFTISQSRNQSGEFVVGHLSNSAIRVGRIIGLNDTN